MIAEIFAIRSAISICETSGFPIIGSPALTYEIHQTPNEEIRSLITDFYNDTVTKKVPLTAEIKARAQLLQSGGYDVGGLRVQDSYHAATAEAVWATYLLTTDIKFINRALKLGVNTKVVNPITFIQEYSKWLSSLT